MSVFFRDRACLLVALVLTSFVRPAPAFGQTAADPRADARMRLGPLYATPALALKEFGVDTNVFNTAEGQRDFTFTLAPHVTLWVPFARRALLTTTVAADFVYYQTYASERSIDPDVHVRGEVFLNRVTLFVEPSYLRSRQRLNFEVDARAQREERSLGAGASVRIFPKLFIEVAGRHGELAFDADAMFDGTSLQESLNRESRTVSAAIRLELTPLTSIVVRADGGTERFPLSPVRNADTLRITPGVEFKPRALVSGSAYVGFRRFTPLDGAVEPFRGVVARAGLNYTLKGMTRFGFTAERDVSYSYEPLQPYFVIEGYGLTVRQQIVGRSDVTLGGRRYTYSYRDRLPAVPGAGAPGRVDTIRAWSADVGYRFGEGLRLGFGATYHERLSSSVAHRDYRGFRFGTTLDYGF